MKLENIAVRKDYQLQNWGDADVAPVSVWFYPENSTAFPIVLRSDGITPLNAPTDGTFEDDYVFDSGDYDSLSNSVENYYLEGNLLDLRSDEPLRDLGLAMIGTSFITGSLKFVHHIINEHTPIDKSNIPDEKVQEMETDSQEVSEIEGYPFEKFEDLAFYHSDQGDDYFNSLWGVTSEGNEYCVYHNYVGEYTMPVTPEVSSDNNGREIMSDNFYDVMLSNLAHLKVTRQAIDGTIFMDDSLSDFESRALYEIFRLFQEFSDENYKPTVPMTMMIDLVRRKKADEIEDKNIESLFGL